MSGPATEVVYEFGDFRLDVSRRLLFAKGTSEPLAITPRVFDTMLYFVEHRGQLLEKSRLMADLWPGVVVEENNLTQVISSLRHALGEAPGENRYLVTAPGRGYRFVADVVRVCDTPAAEAPSAPAVRSHGDQAWHARLVALAALTACVAGVATFTYRWSTHSRGQSDDPAAPHAVRSGTESALPPRNVAVLAFENRSADPRDEYVTFGISESVLHRLAGVRDLNVIAQTSSFAVRAQSTDARDLGRKLNARYLVEGSVQRDDDRLRVTAQLIDAATGVHVWSIRFDRAIEDIFAVEDDIAHGVARALEVSLNDPQHPFARFGTDAYMAFLQGRALVATRRIADAAGAIERFSHAIELAPTFAAAYAALADAHRHLAYLHEDRTNAREIMAASVEKAEPFLTRALQLDDSLGEAYVTRADFKAFKGDVSGAEADYRHGLALSPNYGVGHEHYADFLWTTTRRNDEALAELDAARRIDPLTPRNHYYKGLLLFLEMDDAIEEAEGLFLQSLQVAPDFFPALLRLAQIRWRSGRFAEAVKLGEQAVAIDPRAEWLRWFLVDFYLELGDVDAARSVLAEQPTPVHPSQWLAICSYERKPQRAADLVRTYADRDSGWFSDQDIVAYALRDAAQAIGELARGRRELLSIRVRGADPPTEDVFRSAALAHVNHVLGNRHEAERLARQLLHGTHKKRPLDVASQKAVALTVLGQPEAAIELLEQSFAGGYMRRWWYVLDREPAFEPLRSNPRFQSLSARAHAHSIAQRQLLEQLRERGEAPKRTASAASSAGVC